jgi:cbb3-type cytochrome oxidase maturation protein
MSNEVVILMMSASITLGFFGLLAFLWGLKSNQFDDNERNMNSVLFDSTDDLNDAVQKEAKKKEYEKKAKV